MVVVSLASVRVVWNAPACRTTNCLLLSRSIPPRDIALDGLEKGISLPCLTVVNIRGKGYGVVTTQPIKKGSYVTDYKYGKILHSKKAKEREVADHVANKEGCYRCLLVVVGCTWTPLGATTQLPGKP